jgi:hypothetical protein
MKSKAKHFYTLLNSNGREVQIDLANYKVTCTVTGARKSFYHKYLAGLIKRDYGNCIDTFRTTYVSRAGRPTKTQAERLNEQIERARARLNQLLEKQSTLTD